MNLLFRLLKVLLRYRLRPRQMDLLGESRVAFRVWPNDLDTNGHMNNGRYLTLLDLGRLDLLLRIGAAGVAMKRRWYPVLGGLQVRFRRPLNLFQTFEIRTRIAGWEGRWVYLEQKLQRRGALVAHAYLKGTFVGPAGTVSIADLLGLMGKETVSPPLPPALTAWLLADAEMVKAAEDKGVPDRAAGQFSSL